MNELVVLENINAVTVFSEGGVDDLLKKITDEARSIVADVETARGRRDIAAMAHKVAKSKTYLDGLGKDLVSDWKSKSKAVDNERKKVRDSLDTLKAEIRQPLTDWEKAEEDRVARHENNLSEIIGAGEYSLSSWMELSAEAMSDRLKEIEAEEINDSWEEFANDAAKAKDQTITQIKEAIAKREKHDSEQKELAKLRAESEEREQKEREESLRREGEEKAKREAEAKAKEESERSEREKKAAIQAKEDAERRAEEAERNAARDAENAAQAERDRIDQERIAEEAAAKKREADNKHRAKINNTAVDAFVVVGLSKAKAKDAVTAIAKGQIPQIRISY